MTYLTVIGKSGKRIWKELGRSGISMSMTVDVKNYNKKDIDDFIKIEI